MDSNEETPMVVDVQNSRSEFVKRLIDSGEDTQWCDKNGYTALHHASVGKSVEVVQYLVNKGLPVDKKALKGETPLMLAAIWSNKEIFELLINSGADIHCCEYEDGLTVLHYASVGESVEVVQFLVNRGVALNKKNHKGESPLIMAAQLARKEIVELLVNSGADIHCCDEGGWTVLHHVSVMDSVEVVQFLVNKGVAIDKKNSDGETPLYVAVAHKQIKVAECLLKVGADCNLENHKGESPFNCLFKSYCLFSRVIEIIKLCIEKGAYVKSTDYNKMLDNPLLKRAILEDIELCFHLVINKFNNRDLPLLYKRLAPAQRLPSIDQMKMRSGMALEVKKAIANEIQAKGFCNVFKMVPIVLGYLCVRYFIEKT